MGCVAVTVDRDKRRLEVVWRLMARLLRDEQVVLG